MSRLRTRLVAGLAALAALGVTAGCGLGTAGGFVPTGELAGPLADVERLDGASVAVGSKNFSEQVLLGKMAVILLRSAGADSTDLTNIPGSASARSAQLEGQVDLEWEYTGTAWISYLGHTEGIPDEEKQYEAVRDEDLKKNDLVWFPPAPMNNTYGFATTQKVAQQLGVEKLSDLVDVPPAERTFCVESEFANRNDGLEPMLEAYDIPLEQEVPRSNLKILDTGAIYAATAKGTCNFGEVFTTDGRIKALDLKVLEDDRNFFPAYNVSVVVRNEVFQDYPQIEELFAPVAEKLDDQTLIDLNAKIDVEGREPADVAMEWLKAEGFIE
ncbi:MAG TPA: glycine betaine ABC transporter substrate-binding protein [Nocardioidaceae bacterium]|nr:glycine betaine ABC transporter substrate-binding protein [Nocardioidaceae bacterium]